MSFLLNNGLEGTLGGLRFGISFAGGDGLGRLVLLLEFEFESSSLVNVPCLTKAGLSWLPGD